jgi:hypothetical protein
MNADLLAMWGHINAKHFAGALTPVADIEWLPLSGEEGIEAFGIYFPRSNAIALDERFKPDAAAIRAGDETEEAKLEVAYRLLIHEMVHQAQHQRKLPRAGGHGPSFIEIATPIAEQLGIAPPTEAVAGRWPELGPLLAAYGL